MVQKYNFNQPMKYIFYHGSKIYFQSKESNYFCEFTRIIRMLKFNNHSFRPDPTGRDESLNKLSLFDSVLG